MRGGQGLREGVFFEGCLPVEVIASRGRETLRFGPMKPVGLRDPRTGERPYAVVQLRQDNLAASHYSLVGFQTHLKWGEQKRIIRMIPGLGERGVRALRDDPPQHLRERALCLTGHFETRRRPGLFFAGQMSGVEGYVESAASGLVAGIAAAARARGEAPEAFPAETAIGALAPLHLGERPRRYRPTNIAFGLLPELPRVVRDKTLAGSPSPTAPSIASNASGLGSGRRAPAARRLVRTAVQEMVQGFLRHLALERSVSAHTVKAYREDLGQFVA